MVRLKSLSCTRDTIRFGSKVNDQAIEEFVPALYDCIGRSSNVVVLDFSRCQRAYADAVLPMICLLDHRRTKGDTFRIVLPKSSLLAQLFMNANWAHYLDPNHQRLDIEHPQHLSLRRFQTHAEQQRAVNDAMDVVLRNMDLRRDVLQALEWAMNEITDNVLNHAQAAAGGLVQVSTFRDEHRIHLNVADGGRGIPTAMRERFPELETDIIAIDEAVKAGVTSIPDSGQGNGLAGSLRIATSANGSFKVTSGKVNPAGFHAGCLV